MPKDEHKKQLFISHYLSGDTPVEAARKAGYSATGSNLATRASVLLRDHAVRQAIEANFEKKLQVAIETGQEIGMSSAEAKERIAEIARNGSTERVRLQALELVGKSHALFTEGHAFTHRAASEVQKVYEFDTFAELPPAPQVLAEPDKKDDQNKA